MTKIRKKYYWYSICFKEKVVEEVSSGIRKFGRDELLNTVVRIEMKGERDRLKELESENRSLKIAAAKKTIALDAMERSLLK
ncbi:MAG: hypothetical protein LBK58_12255 [Prevotellaceae bacterium]|jgi:hypothetical protein|nr:hypothetical protein [Prevotellaceae bacterium]